MLKLDISWLILKLISSHISQRPEYAKTEFRLTCDKENITLSPTFNVRPTGKQYGRGTVDIIEHIMNEHIALQLKEFNKRHAAEAQFYVESGQWVFVFGSRKRRRWERID